METASTLSPGRLRNLRAQLQYRIARGGFRQGDYETLCDAADAVERAEGVRS